MATLTLERESEQGRFTVVATTESEGEKAIKDLDLILKDIQLSCAHKRDELLRNVPNAIAAIVEHD